MEGQYYRIYLLELKNEWEEKCKICLILCRYDYSVRNTTLKNHTGIMYPVGNDHNRGNNEIHVIVKEDL